jgi:orotate phosphoribosyltransferase
MGAVPLAGAIAQLSWIKGHPIAAFFVRKKPKEHGAKLLVEGLAKHESIAGKRVAIIEDVTTTGGSALKAANAAREAGAEIARAHHGRPRRREERSPRPNRFRSLYKAGEFLKE